MLLKLRQLGNRSLKSSAAPVLNGLLSGKRWLDGSKQMANQVTILGYHQVVTDITRTEREGVFSLAISAQSFRRQMEFARQRYEVLTLDEAAAVLRGQATTRRPALVITFDDGYRNVYENAFPVLREMGLPATVYLNTGLVGTNQLLDHDLLYWYARRAKGLGLSLRVPLVKAGFNLRQVAETTALGVAYLAYDRYQAGQKRAADLADCEADYALDRTLASLQGRHFGRCDQFR